MPSGHIRLAHQKKLPVVMGELLTGTGSRSRLQLRLQKFISRTVECLAPRNFAAAFNWESYRLADAIIANTPWEAYLMAYLFNAPQERIHIVPNGVEKIFFNSSQGERGPWLVCTATITERKRVLELAAAGIASKTPLWIIGKAYADTDPYHGWILAFNASTLALVTDSIFNVSPNGTIVLTTCWPDGSTSTILLAFCVRSSS